MELSVLNIISYSVIRQETQRCVQYTYPRVYMYTFTTFPTSWGRGLFGNFGGKYRKL